MSNPKTEHTGSTALSRHRAIAPSRHRAIAPPRHRATVPFDKHTIISSHHRFFASSPN
jgi:hypothetical protein